MKGPETRNSDDPVFKPVFGADWDKLPPLMRRRFASRPYREDRVTVEGLLDVSSSPLGRMLKPLFRLTGTLVPYEGRRIPVTVHFVTNAASNAFGFDRTFHFPGRKPYRFRSAMIPTGGNEIVEMMAAGIGLRMSCTWTGAKLVLAHKAYVINLFGHLIPLPLGFLIGRGYAEETPLNENEYAMMAEIRHPLWGRVFGYSGAFRVTRDR